MCEEIKKVIKNVIVDNGLLNGDEVTRYFGGAKNTKVISLRKKDGKRSMYDLLVAVGVYRNIETARRAWTKTGESIPSGLNTYTKYSKTRITEITVYMPEISVIER